jgi:hypothetical protein
LSAERQVAKGLNVAAPESFSPGLSIWAAKRLHRQPSDWIG